jgi:hypothetical protein
MADAAFYDIQAVIVKESLSPLEKMTQKGMGIITVGTMKDFIKDEIQTGAIEGMQMTIKGRSTINPTYTFHESDIKNNLLKCIAVEIEGCETFKMADRPKEDSLRLDMGSKGRFNVHGKCVGRRQDLPQ